MLAAPLCCVCGATVSEDGHHGFLRHVAINDIIRRAMVLANVPSVLEPPALSRIDGKRPDGSLTERSLICVGRNMC